MPITPLRFVIVMVAAMWPWVVGWAGRYPVSGVQAFSGAGPITNLGDESVMASSNTGNDGHPAAAVLNNPLRLTQFGTGNTLSSFKLPNLDPGQEVQSRDASFRVRMSASGTPADGWSLNVGPIPVGNGGGEGGFAMTQGLTIAFDTYDNGGDTPSIEGFANGISVGNFPRSFGFDTAFRQFAARWDSSGLDITYTVGSTPVAICTNLPTPATSPTWNRIGQPLSATQAGGHSWTYAYNAATLLLSKETIAYDTDGNGIADFTRDLHRSHDDPLLRPTGWDLKNGVTSQHANTYTYEATAGRTATVVVGSDIFTYAYKTNAPHLVATVTKSGSPVLQTINTWEPNRDVLDWKENKAGSTSVSKYDYTVNPMGRRTNASQTGTAFAASNSWTWGYNTRGEIATADSSIAAYDRAYQTDEIANLRKTSNIAEYESGALTRAHTWGLDLSGSLQSAGGVGGLLASKIDGTTYYPTYDGNGNVSEYLNASGTVVAHYEYDAFGNIMNALTGLAPSFNIRFSTKYIDRSTAFYYYGFRYYQPFIGRWLNRDPIGEEGGLNVYMTCYNDCNSWTDVLGRERKIWTDPNVAGKTAVQASEHYKNLAEERQKNIRRKFQELGSIS